MLSVAIKIDLKKLSNPEADLRYQLPSHLEDITDNKVKDDGYDYTEDGDLVIFLIGDDHDALPIILKELTNSPFQDNDLTKAMLVGADFGGGYDVVYPKDYAGVFVVE